MWASEVIRTGNCLENRFPVVLAPPVKSICPSGRMHLRAKPALQGLGTLFKFQNFCGFLAKGSAFIRRPSCFIHHSAKMLPGIRPFRTDGVGAGRPLADFVKLSNGFHATALRHAPLRISSGTPPRPPHPPWAWRYRWRPGDHPRTCGPSGYRSRPPWRRPPRRHPDPCRR